jgi:hypothetical protein
MYNVATYNNRFLLHFRDSKQRKFWGFVFFLSNGNLIQGPPLVAKPSPSSIPSGKMSSSLFASSPFSYLCRQTREQGDQMSL